jgi:hypothetical protein
MDVDDLSLAIFAAELFDIVVVSNFGTVAVGCHSVLIPAHDLGNLSM